MNNLHLFYASVEEQGRVVYCQFQFIHTTGGGKYFVKAQASDGSTGSFEMKRNDSGRWHLILPAPQWITTAENSLHKMIVQNSKEAPSLQKAAEVL